MTETRRARTQALARRIGELLDRGTSPEAIRMELTRRGMPAGTAAELIRRVVQAKQRARGVTPPIESHVHVRAERRESPLRHALRLGRAFLGPRRTSAPIMLGCAALTLFGGFQLVRGDDDGAAELVARLAAEVEATQTQIFRLEAELVSRKQQAQEIEAMRARIGAGPVRFVNRDAYRSAVNRYQRQLRDWNATVELYQQIGREYTELVELHNAKADSLAAVSRGR